MSRFTNLKQTCQKYQETLDQLQVGVVSSSETISLEHEIMELKEIEKFIDSKIKVLRVSDISQIPIKGLKLEELQSQITEKMLKLQITENATHFVRMEHIKECLKNKTTKDNAFHIYKQKILQQFERFKNNCESIITFYTQQQQSINTNTHFALRFRTQVVFAEVLENKKKKLEEEQTKGNEAYGDGKQMERVNERLLKINFMRVFMSRLLYCTDLKKYPEFREILISSRHPVTIDSLLKE